MFQGHVTQDQIETAKAAAALFACAPHEYEYSFIVFSSSKRSIHFSVVFSSSVQSLNSCRGVYVSFDLRGFCYLSVFLTWLLHKHSALNFNLYGMRYAIRAALRVLTFCETHQPAVWRIHTSARNASDRMISPRVDWGWESTIFRFQFQFTICVRE